MGKLILIRHGQTAPLGENSGMQPDVPISAQLDDAKKLFWLNKKSQLEAPLTDKGREQAEQTASFFNDSSEFSIKKIYSSTSLRAVNTATILSHRLGIPFSRADSSDTITERMNFGDHLDQTWNGFLEEWRKLDEDPSYRPQHPYIGDSTYDSGQKMDELIRSLPEIEGDTVIVSHGGRIRDYANQRIVEGNYGHTLTLNQPDALGRETRGLANLSLTVVRKEGDRYIVESLGTTAHLDRPEENGLPKSQPEGILRRSKEG